MNKTLMTLGLYTVLSLLSATAIAESDADNGKILFDKADCQKCHSTDIFTKENSKITNLKELKDKVNVCDSQLSVNWFDDEVDDVVAYLNRDFYKLDEEKEKENLKQEESKN
ncbi:MAG: Unknown protein [uncultured Thiotrichaceae bacterium]|uniref:Cytochrome c domain-containing protein n=1 Tax=uncultured Thiotrichaceae bacterium TaxID=298394 RepID=A0A6S6U671_9GAMM|nr:MAG: Unknown protein [uncultured Thiotrichaceae bacterium]